MDTPPPVAALPITSPIVPASHPVPRPAPAPESAPAPEPAGEPAEELSEREVGILDFERRWWRHAGSKEQAIRDEFGLSATRYYQLLNRLLDRTEALAYDPMLVKRLRRLRASRSRARRLPGGHER